MLRSLLHKFEKLDPKIVDGRHHECAVQKLVVVLARRFRNQETTVAGCPMQKSPFMKVCRFVLCANGVVRAQLTHLQCIADVLVDSTPDLNQTAERSFCVGRAGVQQHAVTDIGNRINPLADGTGRVATFERNGSHQKM